jgi:hypothetical protein
MVANRWTISGSKNLEGSIHRDVAPYRRRLDVMVVRHGAFRLGPPGFRLRCSQSRTAGNHQ